jgi:hypothetical protein
MNDFIPAVESSPSNLEAPPDRGIHQGVHALALLLDGLLSALARVTHTGKTATAAGVAWLLPLSLATVELEYAVRHGARVDARLVARACDDVRSLLDEDRPRDPAFNARYAAECASSSAVARMHEAVLDGCRRVSMLTGRATASAVQGES